MKTKKVVVSVVVGVLVVALVLGGFFHWENRRIHNVFDEMYVSVVMQTRNWNVFHEAGMRFNYPEYTDARFGFVKETGRMGLLMYSDHSFMSVYKETSLNAGEDVVIRVFSDDETMRISAYIETGIDQELNFKYCYSFKSRTLEIEPLKIYTRNADQYGVEAVVDDGQQVSAFLHEHNISRAYIEGYRDYFLYDRLLTDWLTGNSKYTKFAVDNYGDFKLIDNTFANLGQDWA